MVVVDEQHKFGVEQRNRLRQKGKVPDTLVMTATPIPRSLVLSVFGDMDVSLLKEKPEGRQDILTYWVGESKRESVYKFIKDEIKHGRQAFIVYPRVRNSSLSDLKSVEDMYEHLKKDIFKDFKVAAIHGKVKSDDKKKIMGQFKNKKYRMKLMKILLLLKIY